MLATEQAMPAKKFRLSVKIAATVLILVAVAGFFEAEAPIALLVNDALKIHPVRPQSTYIIPREFNHYRYNGHFMNAVSSGLEGGKGFIYQRLSLGRNARRWALEKYAWGRHVE